MKSLGEKPTAAFALSLVGAIFMILGGLVSVILTMLFGGFFSIVPGMEWFGGLMIILGILGLIFGILVLVGAIMIYSGERDKVRTGSILVLVFSILNLIFGSGGFFIGFILGLIGGILGLVWKPEARGEAPPPPPV